MTATTVYDTADYRDLLAGVLAHTAADLPRLVLADFLEENGEAERAEFIRLQCERASNPDRAACDRCRREWSRINKSSYPVPMSWCEHCRADGPFWPDVVESLRLRDRERQLWLDNVDRWFPLRQYGHVMLRPANETEQRNGHTVCVLRRGFIAEVSAPLATLYVGELCTQCGGAGRMHLYIRHGDHEESECWDCHGTGRTVGLLPRLVREQPIEVVRVTDGEPWSDGPGSTYFSWVDNMGFDSRDTSHYLPTDVFDLMKRHHAVHSGLQTVKRYPTREAADAALSDALLAWAKGVPA